MTRRTSTAQAQAQAQAKRTAHAQGASPDMAPMASDEATTAAGALPPWLEPDNDNITPEALRPLYEKLDPKITQKLEHARQTIRDGYVQGVLEAHAALDGQEEVSFKDWCLAAHINHNTAKSIVHRAEAAERGANAPRPPAPPAPPQPKDDDDDTDKEQNEPKDEPDRPQPQPQPDPPQPQPQPQPKPEKTPVLEWTWKFKDATDKERAVHIVHQVMEDGHAASYEEAFLYLGDLYADWVCPAQQRKAG